LTALVAIQNIVGCSRFVWKEDPFTPDPAPTTEVIAVGADTTYVLRGASYYLLARQRNALWNREVLDDVAWRYRALFGEAPPAIAVRFDTAATDRAQDSTWRGMPLATVAPRRRAEARDEKAKDARDRREEVDSVRARLVAGSMLAATAAEAWLDARAHSVLPAWMEAGALRIMASGGAPDRATAELRANQKGIVPLASLFAVAWQRRPNATEIVRSGSMAFDVDGERAFDEPPPTRTRRDQSGGVSSLFIAQSVSVLAFIHERDAALIARLADELPRGASFETVLASSATLPHDGPAFETEWRKWLQRSARRR
jgi:hypothetical protein